MMFDFLVKCARFIKSLAEVWNWWDIFGTDQNVMNVCWWCCCCCYISTTLFFFSTKNCEIEPHEQWVFGAASVQCSCRMKWIYVHISTNSIDVMLFASAKICTIDGCISCTRWMCVCMAACPPVRRIIFNLHECVETFDDCKCAFLLSTTETTSLQSKHHSKMLLHTGKFENSINKIIQTQKRLQPNYWNWALFGVMASNADSTKYL